MPDNLKIDVDGIEIKIVEEAKDFWKILAYNHFDRLK
jgi:hypothetical protein